MCLNSEPQVLGDVLGKLRLSEAESAVGKSLYAVAKAEGTSRRPGNRRMDPAKAIIHGTGAARGDGGERNGENREKATQIDACVRLRFDACAVSVLCSFFFFPFV